MCEDVLLSNMYMELLHRELYMKIIYIYIYIFYRAGRTILDHMKSGSETNVRDAVLFLIQERRRWNFKRNPSIYRELLFLLILEFGANIINPG